MLTDSLLLLVIVAIAGALVAHFFSSFLGGIIVLVGVLFVLFRLFDGRRARI